MTDQERTDLPQERTSSSLTARRILVGVTLGTMLTFLGSSPLNPSWAQTATDTGSRVPPIEELRQRAIAGDVDAMHQFAFEILNNHDLSDDTEGLDWLRRSAEAGKWQSAYYLAQAYLGGWHGLSNEDLKNLQAGVRWLRMAGQNVPPDTEGGDVYTLLGRIYSGFYIRGMPSDIVPIDNEEATKWYRLCAVEYSSYCQRELAQILLDSPTSQVEGYKWLHHAAELGNSQAMYQLGELFQIGRIVQKDPITSLAWFESAKKWNPGVGSFYQGLLDNTKGKIRELSQLLSSAEIEKAHVIANKFQPTQHY